MLKSMGFRFFIIGALTLLMSIPALFVADVINERASYSRDTARALGQEWGGPQTLLGPVIRIPVEETVTVTTLVPVIDPVSGIQQVDAHGNVLKREVRQTKIEAREPIFLLPDVFEAEMQTETQTRYRGFFSIPVYTAEVRLRASFDFEDAVQVSTPDQRILWDRATLQARVTSNRALRGDAVLQAGEATFKLEPMIANAGFFAALGDPRELETFTLSLGLFGANDLRISPVGRSSVVTLASDWPHPSFQGAFLPNTKEISDTRFSARWRIPHLARTLPQAGREDPLQNVKQAASFGVAFYQPNDFYQKSYRAARYGMMFIGLTFLAIFLLDGQRDRPTHPVQYVLIGLAQLTFFLLMVSLAEQIGFAAAYGAAGATTAGLITMFGGIALRLGRRTTYLGGILALLYAVLYLILQSADYALLAGSMLAFLAIAATMFATRNEDWSQGGGVMSWLISDPKPAPPK